VSLGGERELRRLQSVWERRLHEDGFFDIERAGEDGPLDDSLPEGAIFSPQLAGALDAAVAASLPVLAAAAGIQSAARDALWQKEIWQGLPRRARKVWALLVIPAWSVTRAATFVGVDDRIAFRWCRQVQERIAERGRRG
jgi:hypothetical protein